ncbi:MAG TPA: right-handed parallel beta-helix repeat-containing protein [Planctomycetota bacterium]|nr:right-handed parallel beta-helix repeat-containing protein [Planctomycetota bacterium]
MRSPQLLLTSVLLLSAASLPAQLAGTYVVGPGGSYPNIAAAITALSASGVAAPVTFLVLANDTGPWTIPAFAGQGPLNPVVFDTVSPITISGPQPLLTLNGCASVTFRGFNGTFTSSSNTFVINSGTTDCVFTNCDFRANVATSGVAVFNFAGGSGCRIEDSTFGGAYEALYSAVANTGTTVQRCRIIGGGWRIMTLGGTDFTLVNNYITGTTNYGINGGIPSTPTSGVNLKIWHNSVYIAHPTSGSQYCSLRWYSSAGGTEVVDNVFYDYFPTSSTTVFNLWCLGALRPALMDYNCLWSNQPGYVPVFASANQTFAQWQALGFDTHSIQADPMFVAPTAMVPDLALQAGSPCATAGFTLPSVLTDFSLAPRTPPVSIGADEDDSGAGATYAIFGAGCAGSAGVVSNTIDTPPQLGQVSTITFGNLPPPNIAFALVGLSNTVSAFGPLPIDLTILGAPGCMARVSLDVATGLSGVGGTVDLVFLTPNQMSLLGFTFYTQALAFDPPINAFGASFSDAAIAIVGL